MKDLITYLSVNKNIKNLAMVGSYKNVESPNVDFIVLINENITIKTIIRYLKKYFKVNQSINEDVVQFKKNKKTYSFMVERIDLFKNRFEKIYNGKSFKPIVCNWVIVGWLPESFMLDLSEMLILKDDGYLKNIKDLLKVYPKGLQKSIIAFSDEKIKNLEKLLKNKEINNFTRFIAIMEKKIYTIRKEYAKGGVYLHSFKQGGACD